MKEIAETPTFLSLPCIRIEILSQTKQEMSLSTGDSVSQLVLDWIKRCYDENEPVMFFNALMEKVCLNDNLVNYDMAFYWELVLGTKVLVGYFF